MAVATGKLDGLLFLLGCLFGVFVFDETVPAFRSFWEHAGASGRVTLPDWMGLNAGVVVFLVMLMAMFMFWGGEKLEAIFGSRKTGGRRKA